MKPDQAMELITMLMGAYDKEVQPSTLHAYSVYILALDYELVKKAILQLPLTHKWFPSISEVMAAVRERIPRGSSFLEELALEKMLAQHGSQAIREGKVSGEEAETARALLLQKDTMSATSDPSVIGKSLTHFQETLSKIRGSTIEKLK